MLFILQGVSLALTPPLDGSGRWSNLGAGAIAAAAGDRPDRLAGQGLSTVGVFVGIFVSRSALLHIVGALSNRQVPNWWLMLVLGLSRCRSASGRCAGPGQTIVILVTLMGAWAVVTGI